MTLTKAHIVEALFAQNIFTKTESAQIDDTAIQEGGDIQVLQRSAGRN